MSWIEGKMLGFDLEATGPDPLTAVPVSFALVDVDFGQMGKMRHGLINPGMPIPPDSTKIHGITDEMVRERGGDLDRSVLGITEMLVKAAEQEIPVTGMNLRYDLTVIDRLLRESGGVGLREHGWDGYVLDIMVLDRGLDRYRKGRRTLSALCDHYGVEHGGAHAAIEDVIASIKVLAEISKRYPDIRQMDLQQLYEEQQEWHRDWAEHFSEYRVSQGDAPLPPAEHDWPLLGERAPHRDRPITDGQVVSLRIRLKEDHEIEDRVDVLDIVSAFFERPISSTKELTEAEYHSIIADLEAVQGTEALALILSDAREARGPSIPPPSPSEPHSDESSPGYEPFEDPDIGDASPAVVQSTMRKVMNMKSDEVNEWLRTFELPRKGPVADRRLRLYEFCCRERAKKNEEVEVLFQ
jgi:DNA polymerase-3 subunit epsilon